MAVTLRLSRHGSKKRPFYHLIATDKRNPRDGKYIEKLGYYDPRAEVLVVEADKVQVWLSYGAEVSGTVSKLLKRAAKAQSAVASA